MRKIFKFIIIAILMGVVAATSYQLYNYFVNVNNDKSKDNVDFIDNEEEMSYVDNDETVFINDFSTIVDNTMPSIVAVNPTYEETVRDFFGRRYTKQHDASGSGFIIGQNNKELLIVTNNHVVEGASNVEIVFNDGESVSSVLRGSNEVADLAILCVKTNDLPKKTRNHIRIATIGNSNNVQLGDLAIAIGNALGYGQSVTVGHISAIEREVDVEGRSMSFMQTDASINPGNSGGALLNSRGEVIGINTMKFIGQNVEGIGYTIPISEVLELINHLINRTYVDAGQEAYLGISSQDVTETYSKRFNMPIGVFVNEVEEGSPANNAGIKAGDIITAVNEIPVESKKGLKEILDYTQAGSSGTVRVSSLDEGEYVERTLDIIFAKRN